MPMIARQVDPFQVEKKNGKESDIKIRCNITSNLHVNGPLRVVLRPSRRFAGVLPYSESDEGRKKKVDKNLWDKCGYMLEPVETVTPYRFFSSLNRWVHNLTGFTLGDL